MAYRKLGIEYGNRDLTREGGGVLREGVSRIGTGSAMPSGMLLLGSYYELGRHQDAAKSDGAYERLLGIQPNNTAG
jgi:hypothetical protein